jgi:hypothetical protein
MAPETPISGIANNERNRQNGEHFGDYITKKISNILRAGFLNIGGFSLTLTP